MRKCLTLFLLASLACFAGSPKAKMSSDLFTRAGQSSVQVVVQWNVDIGARTSQKILALGGGVISQFAALETGVYLLPNSAVASLSEDPDVKFVSVDRKVRKKAAAVGITPATVNAPAVWRAGYTGLGVGVAILDSGIDADDEIGSVLKAPVYSEDFTVAPTTAPDGKLGPKPQSYGVDWFGHGQHLAGIIASNGKNSQCGNCTQTFLGIAPSVNLIDLKVLDVNGEGSDSSVIAAIDRAISLRKVYNIRVMNLSLGRPAYESYAQDPLCQAVEAAWKAGIVVVVSAGNEGRDNSFGNEGYGTIEAPGNDPSVITVGAMRSMGTATRADDLIASYSSKGPSAIDHIVKPDLVAPGNQIVSLLAQHATLPLSYPQNLTPLSLYQTGTQSVDAMPAQPAYDPQSGAEPPQVKVPHGYSNRYFILSGTSMATAVVSGAAADLIQANPSLTPDQIKMLMMQTASKTFPSSSTVVDSTTGQSYTSYYDIFTTGAGYLDLQAALALVNQVPVKLTATSPTAVYDSTTGDVELSFDPASVFANQSAWSADALATNKALWGADSLSSNKCLWGASSTWSNSVLAGNKALWGAGSVWSASSENSADKALWGAKAIWGNKALWGAGDTSTSQSIMLDGEQ